MTVTTTVTFAGPFVGDDSNTIFAYTFDIDAASELELTYRDAAGVATILTFDVHYTLSGIGESGGGNITYPKTGSNKLKSTEKLSARRVIPILQKTDLRNQGSWLPENHEAAYDKITKILLQHEELFGRTLTIGVTDTDTDLTILLAAINAAAGHATNAAASADAAAASAAAATNSNVAAVLFQTPKSIAFGDSPYTIVTADAAVLLIVDTSGGNVTVNLPLISGETLPFVIGIKKNTTDSNTVTVVRNGTDEIDSAAANTIMTSFKETVIFTADDTPTPDNWQTVVISLQQGDIVIDNFTVGTDWTADVSTTLPLSVTPDSENDIEIFMDGVTQHHNTYTLSGSTVTFNAAIVTGVTNIEIRIGQDVSTASLSTGSVNSTHILDGTIVDGDINASAAIAWTKIATTGNVALADMADLAQDRIIGRVTASTGVPEALTPAQIVAVIGSALDISNDTTPTLGGDLAAAGFNITGLSHLDIDHTAAEADDHAFEMVVDAAGFPDVKALALDFITGALAAGEEEAVFLTNVDESLSTGGTIIVHEVLATEGSASIYALGAGASVNPILQGSGTFVDMDSALVKAVDSLTAFITSDPAGPNNVDIFVADNDTVTIGDAAKFAELEFLLETGASGSGIAPTFEFSTGVGTWAAFTPVDGTNGMRNSGLIAWVLTDIPSWAVGTGSEFLIRITRTRNTLATVPTEDKVQIAATTLFSWDKNADVSINDLTLAGDLAVAGTVDGRDIATDGTKLDGIEALADVTDATNVAAAGAGMLGTAQEWTKTQNFNGTLLTSTSNSVAWDAESNQVAAINTLGENTTLANPTNMKDGATYILTVIQDATGSRTMAYGTAYEFPGGTAPVLSTAANAVDILTFVCDGTKMRGNVLKAFA